MKGSGATRVPGGRSNRVTGAIPHHSSSRVIIVLVCLTGLLTSCGLPTIPFLAPPRNPGASDSLNEENLILTFEHNPENAIDDFRGYDLYYKLYVSSEDDAIEEDRSIIETTPTQPGPSRLINRGFVRPVAVSERDPTGTTVTQILTDDGIPHLPTSPLDAAIEFRIDLRSGNETDPDADVIISWDDGGGRARGFRRRSGDFGANPQNDLDSFWNRTDYLPANEAGLDDDLREMGFTEEGLSEPPDSLVIIWYVLGVATTLEGRTYESEPLGLQRAVLVLRQ